MELKAYLEGHIRALWLFLLLLPLSMGAGFAYAGSATSSYTASTSILLNAPVLVSTAVPSTIVRLGVPEAYEGLVATPPVLTTINKHYPRLSIAKLRSIINVTSDTNNHILLIRVTDTKPEGAVDIANYLAQQFVKVQSASMQQQLSYYQGWLQQKVTQLTDEINGLNTTIKQLEPVRTRPGEVPPLSPQQRVALSVAQYKVDTAVRNLYIYNQALKDLQSTLPLFKKAYILQHPAQVSDVPVIPPLPLGAVLAIAMGVGLLAFVLLVVLLEYFSPFVRYKGELERVTGLPVVASTVEIFRFEQERLLEERRLPFRWRVDSLRLLCGSLGARALREGNHTLLLTSPHKKRRFASLLATFLAYGGYRTLLIDADFEMPSVQEQVKIIGPCNLVSDDGVALPYVGKTRSPRLFVLPATAMLAQNEHVACNSLITLLPELEKMFDMIIIDGPPLNHADAHLLAPRVKQTLLLVKKRRDRVKTLQRVARQCQELHLQVETLLIA